MKTSKGKLKRNDVKYAIADETSGKVEGIVRWAISPFVRPVWSCLTLQLFLSRFFTDSDGIVVKNYLKVAVP